MFNSLFFSLFIIALCFLTLHSFVSVCVFVCLFACLYVIVIKNKDGETDRQTRHKHILSTKLLGKVHTCQQPNTQRHDMKV